MKKAYPDMPLSVLWCTRVDRNYVWKIITTASVSVFSPLSAALTGSYFLHADMSIRERLAEDQYTTPLVVVDLSMSSSSVPASTVATQEDCEV